MYEYDESTWPVSHPRQCRPYAIVTYCSSRINTPAPLLKIDTCVKEPIGRSKEEKHNLKMDLGKTCLKRLKAGCGLKLRILQKEYLRRAALSQGKSVCIRKEKIREGTSEDSRNNTCIFPSTDVEAEESQSDASDCANDNNAKSIEGSAPELAPSAYPRGDECLSDECPVSALATDIPNNNMPTDGDGCCGRTPDKVLAFLNDKPEKEPPENKTGQVDNLTRPKMDKKQLNCKRGYRKRRLQGKRKMHGSDKSSSNEYRKLKKLKIQVDAHSRPCVSAARTRNCSKSALRKEFVTRKCVRIDSGHKIHTAGSARHETELPKFVYNVGDEDIDYTDIDFDVNDEASYDNLVESEMEISDGECPVTENMQQTQQKLIDHVLVECKTMPRKQPSVSRRKRRVPRNRSEFSSTYQYTIDAKTYVYTPRFSKPHLLGKPLQINCYESSIEKGKTYYYNDYSVAGNPRIEHGPVVQKKSVQGSLNNGSECVSGGRKLSSFEALNKLRCLLSEVGQFTIETSTIVDILNAETFVPTTTSRTPCYIDVEQDAGQSQSRNCDTRLSEESNKAQHPPELVQSEVDIQSEKIFNNTGCLYPYSEKDTKFQNSVKGGSSDPSAKSIKGDACRKVESHLVPVTTQEEVRKPSRTVKRVKCNRPLTCPFNSILPTTFKWKLETLDLPVNVSVTTSSNVTVKNAAVDKQVKPKFNGRTLLKGGVTPRKIPLARSRKALKTEMAVDPRSIKPCSPDDRQPHRQLSTTSETGSTLSSVSSVDSGLPDTDCDDVKTGELSESLKEVTKPPKSAYIGMDDVSLRIHDLINRYKKPEQGKRSFGSGHISCGGLKSGLEEIFTEHKAVDGMKLSKSRGCIKQTGNRELMVFSPNDSVWGPGGHGHNPGGIDIHQKQEINHKSGRVKEAFDECTVSDPASFSGFLMGKRSFEVGEFQDYNSVVRSEINSRSDVTKPEGFYGEQRLEHTPIPVCGGQSFSPVNPAVSETIAGVSRSEVFPRSRCHAFSGNRGSEPSSNSINNLSNLPMYDARQRIQEIRAYKTVYNKVHTINQNPSLVADSVSTGYTGPLPIISVNNVNRCFMI